MYVASLTIGLRWKGYSNIVSKVSYAVVSVIFIASCVVCPPLLARVQLRVATHRLDRFRVSSPGPLHTSMLRIALDLDWYHCVSAKFDRC